MQFSAASTLTPLKVIRGVVLLGLSAVMSLATWQVAAKSLYKSRHRPPGRLVDVGGHRLHLNITGEDHGLPTIVLESGLGYPYAQWARVQPKVASFARVVSYDRAGYGWSDAGPRPRAVERVVAELRSALKAAQLDGPYVLVGHSFGGLLSRAFAEKYPEDVAGMVLVDSAHETELHDPVYQRGLEEIEIALGAAPLAARVGLMRLSILRSGWIKEVPRDHVSELTALLSAARPWIEAGNELASWKRSTARHKTAEIKSLSDLPLAVLTAASASQAHASAHADLQAELAALSNQSVQLTVTGSDHDTIVLKEECASVVADQIHRVALASSERLTSDGARKRNV